RGYIAAGGPGFTNNMDTVGAAALAAARNLSASPGPQAK
ncbi:MAG: hypothetical protein RLZZ265_3875, partial [Verrucomicrobiota bacterium]